MNNGTRIRNKKMNNLKDKRMQKYKVEKVQENGIRIRMRKKMNNLKR